MTPIKKHTGIAIPLVRDNIDTDTIIPSREMRSVSKAGLSEGLFAPWRYQDPDLRSPNLDFPMNQPAYSGATIFLGGRNFGCGSSREQAVWALQEWGCKAVIAHSFGTIFRNNATRNGLLTIALDSATIDMLSNWVTSDPQANRLDIDLIQCQINIANKMVRFEIAADTRTMLLEGLDEIGLTEKLLDEVDAFEKRDRRNRPWIYLS